MVGFQGSLRTKADARTAAPKVLSTSVDGSQPGFVPLNPVLDIRFSEALDASTVDSTTVSLRANDCDNTVISSTVALSADGRTIRITPDTLLSPVTPHALCVEGTVQDLDGSSLGARFDRTFGTSDVEDLLPPGNVSVSPPHGTADVGVNSHLHLRFDEPINPLTIASDTVQLADSSDVAVAYTVSLTGNNQDVIITPHRPLSDTALYSLTIDGVTDLAGNAVMLQTTTFSTAAGPDRTRPAVLLSSPVSGATDVPSNVSIQVEFDESIDPLTVTSSTLILYDSADQAVPGVVNLSADGRTLSLVPDAPLAPATAYRLDVTSGVRDLAGNSAGGEVIFTTSP